MSSELSAFNEFACAKEDPRVPFNHMPERTITAHQINECNSAIHITADKPTHGNASHHYHMSWFTPYCGRMQADHARIDFQNGPIKEVGTNGITHEVLLAILIDRLEGFQSGAYACEENAQALYCLRAALSHLNDRTKRRVASGTEGTHALDEVKP